MFVFFYKQNLANNSLIKGLKKGHNKVLNYELTDGLVGSDVTIFDLYCFPLSLFFQGSAGGILDPVALLRKYLYFF